MQSTPSSLLTATAALATEDSSTSRKLRSDSLQARLARLVEQSKVIREAFADKAGDDDVGHFLQALKDGLADSLRILYLGMHAGLVLDDMAEVSDRPPAERASALRLVLGQYDSWLESWAPITDGNALLHLHDSIEYGAVKDLASLLRQGIEPSTEPSKATESPTQMPPGLKVRTEVCPGCNTGHSGPPCPTEQKPAAQATAHQIRMSDVEISTTNYRFAHGHLPKGRGNWAFLFADAPETPWWAPASLMYAEACRKARAEAKRRGVRLASVATCRG